MRRASLILLGLLLVGFGACAETSAPGTGGTLPVDADPLEVGAQVYERTCQACHGADGSGIEGFARPLSEAQLTTEMNDVEMVAFIIEGLGVDHPSNTTGVAMPPRGGNPTLTDADMAAVVAYMRTLDG